MCRRRLSSPRCRSELIDYAWVGIVPGQIKMHKKKNHYHRVFCMVLRIICHLPLAISHLLNIGKHLANISKTAVFVLTYSLNTVKSRYIQEQ